MQSFYVLYKIIKQKSDSIECNVNTLSIKFPNKVLF